MTIPPHVVWIRGVDGGWEALESEQEQDVFGVPNQGSCMESIFVRVVYSKLEELDVYCNDLFVPLVASARVWDAHYS